MNEKASLSRFDPLAPKGDDLNPRLPLSHSPALVARRQGRSTRRLLAILLTILLVWLFLRNADYSWLLHRCHRSTRQPSTSENGAPMVDSARVPLEAHVMSKCPDARDCLQKLIVPTMERVHNKVDFKLSFIGTYVFPPEHPPAQPDTRCRVDPDSDAVACKHGPPECLGNMIILCAEKIYPEPKIHLGFANCLIADYADVPERSLVEQCTMEHGIDFDQVNKCISDEGEGVGLLRSSVLRSSESNVTKSCTVRLNGEVRCIRDGGEWYDCPGGSSVKSLVDDIEDLYGKRAR